MANGNLAGLISTLGESKVIPIAKQVAWACEYLHLRDLVHRDLSARLRASELQQC